MCWRGRIIPMPEPKRRKLLLLWLSAAVLVIAGASVLWWDSQQEVTFYDGSYESLDEGTEIYFGPGPAEIMGSVLALLGIGVAGVALGSFFHQLTRFKTWFLLTGLLLAAAGLATLLWDYNQVRTFGWFAYEPMSKSELMTAGATPILGKLGLAAGIFLTATYWGLRSILPFSRSAINS